MSWRAITSGAGRTRSKSCGICVRIRPGTSRTTVPATPVGIRRRAIPLAAGANRPARHFVPRAHTFALYGLLALSGCVGIPPGDDPPDRTSSLACRHVVPPDALVRWVEPDGRRDRDALARWCDTVGPVLLQPLASQSAAPVIDRLAVMTWNVHVGSGDVADVFRRLRAGEFTGGAPVEHFVLLLQEAYRRDTAVPAQIPRGFPAPSRIAARIGRGPDISHTAKDLGVALFYVPSMRNGIASVDPEDRGNAILSTLDLHDPVVVELPMENQRRAAVVATVQAQARDGSPWLLRVANVHLDTSLAITRGGPFAARSRQAHALIDSLRTPPDIPTVLAGDFNTWWGPTEPALNILRSAFPQTPRSVNTKTWTGPLGLHAQLDYIFLRGPLTPAVVQRLPSRFGSDHYPLLAIVSPSPPPT
jgi:endonuclease/exonuclease/phosphatase family metal-dependent hydrolase